MRALNQREVGYTYNRSSGYYDLVLNGGGDVILDYSKPKADLDKYRAFEKSDGPDVFTIKFETSPEVEAAIGSVI